MNDEDFADLMASVAEAHAYARGEKVEGLRVHYVPAIMAEHKAGLSEIAWAAMEELGTKSTKGQQ